MRRVAIKLKYGKLTDVLYYWKNGCFGALRRPEGLVVHLKTCTYRVVEGLWTAGPVFSSEYA